MSGLRLNGAPRDPSTNTSPRNSSSVPLLQRENDSDLNLTGKAQDQALNSADLGNDETDKNNNNNKTGKRRLFGLGKKKDERTVEPPKMPPQNTFAPSPHSTIAAMRPISPVQKPLPTHTSPNPSFAVSPGRAAVRSSSPQAASSISSSQIFERSVQESTVPSELSDAIPAHIQTEDHIPPALEASSLAITNTRLDPDDVEIVTSTAHQSAVSGISDGVASAMHSDTGLSTSPQDPQHESIYAALSRQHESNDGDNASTYGALDPNDVRRLSFISFADVVQAEHAETSSLLNMPLSSSSLAHGRTRSPPLDRSPSPVHSPTSSYSQSFSQGVTTPPLGSNPVSMKGLDVSPGRSPVGSPHQHGELSIETMRQALRRTGSGDLSAARSGSLPVSEVGGDDGGLDKGALLK